MYSKKFFINFCVLAFLLFISFNAFAITYVQFYINGSPGGTTALQSDAIAIKWDVSTTGAMAQVEFIYDVNNNGTVEMGDKIIHSFMMADNSPGQDGPGDSDPTNGVVLFDLSFARLPAVRWIARITERDNSVTDWLDITEVPTNWSISGKVSGLPDNSGVWVEADFDTSGMGLVCADITDANGNFQIYLGQGGKNWEVSVQEIQGYINPQDTTIFNVNGHITGVNFVYTLPQAYIRGCLVSDKGDTLRSFNYYNVGVKPAGGGEWLYNTRVENGCYVLGVSPGIYDLDMDGPPAPGYLMPDLGNDRLPQYKNISISTGTDTTINIIFIKADTVIPGIITEDNTTPSKSYMIVGFDSSQSYITLAYSDVNTGAFSLEVSSTFSRVYGAFIYTDPYNGTPLPPGYIIENGNWRRVSLGDTIRFNLVKPKGLIKGKIRVDHGDIMPDWNKVAVIITELGNWNAISLVNPVSLGGDSAEYSLPSPFGIFRLQVWQMYQEQLYSYSPNNYIVELDSVLKDTIIGKDFSMNYNHFTLSGHFYGLLSVPSDYWFGLTGSGGYGSNAEINSDGSYSMKLCDATWYFYPPTWGELQNYVVSPPETTFIVRDEDVGMTLDLNYFPFISYYSSINDVRDLAWDGTNMWASSSNKIYKLKAPNINGVIDSSTAIPAPGGKNPKGITFVGNYLWCLDGPTQRLYKLDPSNGAVLDSININKYSERITSDGTYIWLSNLTDNKISRVNLVSKTIDANYSTSYSWFNSIAYDGKNFWLLADGRINNISISSSLNQNFQTTLPYYNVISGMVHQTGTGYIWIADNSSPATFYRIDMSRVITATEEPKIPNLKSQISNFVLEQNYPNPFNPETVIRYAIAGNRELVSSHSSLVTLKIYSITGQLIRTLVNEEQSVGYYSVKWNGKDDKGQNVPTGIYIYKLQVIGNKQQIFEDSKKMLLLK